MRAQDYTGFSVNATTNPATRILQTTKHVVLLSSASGEICVMVTKDKILAESVVAAINEAIVSRG